MASTWALALLVGCGGRAGDLAPTQLDEAEDPTDAVVAAFADSALAAAVGEALRGVAVDSLTTLAARGRGIADLSGIEQLAGLEALDLADNGIADLSPLAGLGRLIFLDLTGNRVRDLSPLSGLASLRVVLLAANEVEDLEPLLSLAQLEALELTGNPLGSAALRQVDLLTAAGVRVDNAVAEPEAPAEPEVVDALPDLPGRLAFASDREGSYDLWVLRGAQLTRVTTDSGDEREPSWSPDGTRIAFSRGRGTRWDLWLIEVATQGETQLTDAWDNRTPAWSPDGARIAFSRATDVTYQQVHVMDADGANVTRLTDSRADDVDPAWSPDGTTIAFTSRRSTAEREGVYLIRPDGSGERRLSGAEEWDTRPAWSPDGKRLAVVRVEGSAGQYTGRPIAILEVDTGRRQTLAIDADLGLGEGEVWARRVTWGQDGWLAFSALVFAPGRTLHEDIYWRDLASGALRALVSDASQDVDPAWTPTE